MSPSKTPAVELEVRGRTVRVSSPDKIYFPERGLTKLDVVQYFVSVGDGILGALLDRPTTLERWPKGVFEGAKLATRTDSTGDAFYQKRVPQGAPDYVQTARIAFPSGRTADEVAPSELAVVAWAANLGTLTFHPWPVLGDDVDSPDQLRIDLDPQPGTDFADAARVAPHVRELLAEHGLEGTPKTSGGRGIHVFVPIEPRWSFVEARRATIAFGRELERRMPDRGHHEVVEGGARPEDLRRLQPDGPRPHHRLGVLDPHQPPRHRLRAAALGRGRGRAPERLRRHDDAGPVRRGRRPVRRARRRTRAPRTRIESLLELADRQEHDEGEGDLPYPPEYPKMPGEPKRVQPSKDRDRPR